MSRYEHDGRTDMRKAALKRRADAWRLLRAGKAHSRGAAYLGGYAVECKFKAIAMEVHGVWTLRQLAKVWQVNESEVYTHGLEALAMHLPLYKNFQRSEVWRDFAGHVNHWRPSWRYDPRDWTEEGAENFLTALDRVYKWLDANRC